MPATAGPRTRDLRNTGSTIDIINNIRGGIQGEIEERANGGQI